MEINMTNSNKPSAKDIKFWEDMKQQFLDRADIINEMDEDELAAVQNLRESSSSLEECSENYDLFDYDDLANFVNSCETLKFEYNWHKSECETKLDVMKIAGKLVSILKDRHLQLNTRDVEGFSFVMWRMINLFDTKPNKHQMGKFTEHGITWEGEFDDY